MFISIDFPWWIDLICYLIIFSPIILIVFLVCITIIIDKKIKVNYKDNKIYANYKDNKPKKEKEIDYHVSWSKKEIRSFIICLLLLLLAVIITILICKSIVS